MKDIATSKSSQGTEATVHVHHHKATSRSKHEQKSRHTNYALPNSESLTSVVSPKVEVEEEEENIDLKKDKAKEEDNPTSLSSSSSSSSISSSSSSDMKKNAKDSLVDYMPRPLNRPQNVKEPELPHLKNWQSDFKNRTRLLSQSEQVSIPRVLVNQPVTNNFRKSNTSLAVSSKATRDQHRHSKNSENWQQQPVAHKVMQEQKDAHEVVIRKHHGESNRSYHHTYSEIVPKDENRKSRTRSSYSQQILVSLGYFPCYLKALPPIGSMHVQIFLIMINVNKFLS